MGNKKSWQIPDKYSEFESTSLIICLAHKMAKPYLVKGRMLQELLTIETEEAEFQYSDKEGFNPSFGGSAPGNDSHNKEHYERVFLNYFVNELKKLQKTHQASRMYIFVPEDLKNITKKKFTELMLKQTEFFHGNMIKTHPLELVERIAIL